MRITCLVENTTGNSACAAEHGLSLFIETGSQCILFDAGASELFAENAEALGVDLSRVDFAVLSHGHYDHGGGLAAFLARNDHAPVYANRHAFERHMDHERYIGLDQRLQNEPRIKLLDDIFSPAPGAEIRTFAEQPRPYSILTGGLSVERDGGTEEEQYLHEQYLILRETGQTVLISGCSHKGIRNIMSWCDPDVLIGGFHFFFLDMEKEAKQILDETARELMTHETKYYTCHCTGMEQYHYLKQKMGGRLHYLATGDVIELGEAKKNPHGGL